MAREVPDELAGDEIDRLFQLPLGEFTRARNALVAELKKQGRADKVEQVKGLTKPSISAWVTNQLYWRERDTFERLLAAGEQYRAAQAAQLTGGSADMHGPLAARRQALTELVAHAAAILRDAGHADSRDTMRRITTTLEAIATYGASRDAPRPGRLTADVDPPGFEALAGLLQGSGERPLRASTAAPVIPLRHSRPQPAPKAQDRKEDARRELAQRRAREAQLRNVLHDAERALKDARREADMAHDRVRTLSSRVQEMNRRRAALEAQIEKVKAEAENVRQEAARAASRAEEAAQAVADAERAVQRAREALKDL